MPTLKRAIQIARIAHEGQYDKAGLPYIVHPAKVMINVSGQLEKMVAILHDVVEDSAFTLDDLREEGFPPEVVDAVDALTKRPGETRIETAKRAALNLIARTVKLVDNGLNMDLSRTPNPTEIDFARHREYEQVRAILLAAG
ncbi:guanosine-3',5'-bis(diphosphate) 3'-pyrophosphohydrolase [Comamonas sp. J-3]|uniref:guanosine-3',5'-bis(diphosphate) 3'-pyrophosphohydrolase n=1 Tax=Comamonas trifloxystrobinivorans TaxID=3350256 RepID=UPI003727066A